MKRIRMLLLILSLTMTGLVAVAQIAPPSKFRSSQRYSRNLGSRRSLPLRTQEPRLPATASPDIVWVQCPPDAQALGATCGTLPVPLDYHHPRGAKITIFFELFLHTNPGPAQSAILANIGGPGLTTTGFNFLWLAMFAPNMDVHDVLLIDDRGRGLSQAIDCEPLQHGLGPTFDDEVADCAAQLGNADSWYSAGDVAVDADAVRAALGYDKVDYYGGSAGGLDVTAYATRFGGHLHSLILDSPFGPETVPFYDASLKGPAVLRSERLNCQRSPTCSPDHHDSDSEVKQLIETIRGNPLQGNAYDASGNLVPVFLDETALFSVLTNSTGNYVSTGEVLAAYQSLSHGDAVPLLRLGAEGLVPLVSDSGDPTFFSFGAAAGYCTDLNVPYDWSASPPVRIDQYAAAVSELEPDYFQPFSKAAATDELNSGDRECLYWEEPTPPAPLVGGPYPAVPTLVLSGDMDTIVPDQQAQEMAALFPNSTFVIVKDGVHEPAEQDSCALSLVNNLIETLQVGDTSCLKTPGAIWPAVGRFPMVAADARPAKVDPAGKNHVGIPERKVVTVAVAAAIDALKRSQIGGGNGVGLRTGTFSTDYGLNGGQTTTLTNCNFANDVAVNGTITWGSDFSFVADLTVSGTGTAGGTLHVEGTWEAPGPVGNFKISGTLGGRQVAVLVPEA